MKIDNQQEKRDRRLQNNIFRNISTKMHHEEEEAAANVPLLTRESESAPPAQEAGRPPWRRRLCVRNHPQEQQ